MSTDNILKVLINRSIDFRNINANDNYFTNFYCLNKLAYLAHGLMLAMYNKKLLDSNIYATYGGPYLKETDKYFYEFDILNPITLKSEEAEISKEAEEIIELVVNNFGSMSAEEIEMFFQYHQPWLNAISKVNMSIINTEEIIEYFLNNDIFTLADNFKNEFYNELSLKLVQ